MQTMIDALYSQHAAADGVIHVTVFRFKLCLNCTDIDCILHKASWLSVENTKSIAIPINSYKAALPAGIVAQSAADCMET